MASASPFLVGANFPWIDCGWDFGEPPQGWRRSPARDWSAVERDLAVLSALGIGVVRWWLLAGGVNYPVGQSITSIATPQHNLLGKHVAWELKPSVPLPPLSDAFLRDFEALCTACHNTGLTLLPSLLSFEWFDRADGTSRGRRSLVMGREGEHHQLAIERFLDATLALLLEAASRHRQAIYAFECINEPDWVVRGGPLHLEVHKSVEPWEMDAFLFLAARRIMHAGFTATVGFKHAGPAWVQPYLWTFLESAASRGAYLHQLHHYPTLLGERTLPEPRARMPGTLVGEFPTSDVWAPLYNYRWADPGLAERDPERYLEARLTLMRERGYGGAFLWNTEPAWIKARRASRGGKLEPDPRVRWEARQQAQVARFTRTLGAPALPRA